MNLYFSFQAGENDKRWSSERADLLRDQAGLQKLHDNLQSDYEALLKERDNQKEVERQLRADLRKLQVEQNYLMYTRSGENARRY